MIDRPVDEVRHLLAYNERTVSLDASLDVDPDLSVADSVADDGSEAPRANNPVGLLGHGADIAHMVMYFCSPGARIVSGQVIQVDGAGSVDAMKLDLSRFD